MLNIDQFKKTIEERKRISDECQDEWDDGIRQCCDREVELLAEDIQSSINYFSSECSEDEFIFISEIIDELAEKTMSKALIDSYKALSKKYQEKCDEYNIMDFILSAELIVTGGDNEQKD